MQLAILCNKEYVSGFLRVCFFPLIYSTFHFLFMSFCRSFLKDVVETFHLFLKMLEKFLQDKGSFLVKVNLFTPYIILRQNTEYVLSCDLIGSYLYTLTSYQLDFPYMAHFKNSFYIDFTFSRRFEKFV